MLSGRGLKKNKEKSHLGSEGLGTANSSIRLPAISSFSRSWGCETVSGPSQETLRHGVPVSNELRGSLGVGASR